MIYNKTGRFTFKNTNLEANPADSDLHSRSWRHVKLDSEPPSGVFIWLKISAEIYSFYRAACNADAV